MFGLTGRHRDDLEAHHFRGLVGSHLVSQVQQQRERFPDLGEGNKSDIASALTKARRGHGTHVLALRRGKG